MIMCDTGISEDFEENLFQFIKSSVSEIHQVQEADAYMEWVKINYTNFLPQVDDYLKLALLIAQTVWDATPLSSNRYRPSPLPELKRNSPCLCGSGKKYKQCCLQIVDSIPPMDSQDIWELLLEEMTVQEVEKALALHALPIPVMLGLAEEYEENGMTEAVIEILEPIFTLSTEKMAEAECAALTKLCNAYDNIGLLEMQARKTQLLHSLKDIGSRLIRSEAWQRLSVILIDKDEKKPAWEAFQKAQRLTPNSPGVDLLEINLLIGEGKIDLAQQRSEIILKKLQRNGVSEDSPYIEFFQSVANDPQKVVNELFHGQTNNQVNCLGTWLEQLKGRRLPIYKLESFIADYSWMNLGEKVEVFQADLFAEKDIEEDEMLNDLPENEYRLITPKSIIKLDQQWSKLIDNGIGSFPWEKTEWLEFLEEHPQCFGSVKVIDDLLTGLEEWAQDEKLLRNLVLPLSQRAWQIYESLPEQGGMPWAFVENRSLYSALHAIVSVYKLLGQNDKAVHYATKLIIINPNDNLGLRSELVNGFLTQQMYNKVFELLRFYPDDILLEIRMAKVLALWAVADKNSAKKHWGEVKKSNPYIKKYMIKSKIKAPELHPTTISMGGEDEAWYYRQSAREIWLAHKGAINWLKHN